MGTEMLDRGIPCTGPAMKQESGLLCVTVPLGGQYAQAGSAPQMGSTFSMGSTHRWAVPLGGQYTKAGGTWASEMVPAP